MKKIFAHARRSTFPTLLALALLFAGLGPWPFGAPKAHATNTPTLIQHVASSANPVGVGISGNAFKIPLPNAVGAGNALILGITYPHGKTVTITDNNGNTWPGSATKSVDAGTGAYISAIYVLPNANAGATIVTVTFNTTVIPFEYTISEFDNIATASPTNGTSGTANVAGASVSTGSFTPGNNDANGGNLIWNYYAISGNAGGNPTSWVSGGSFTLLDGDIAWENNQGFPHGSQYYVQTTSASINPSITATGDSADSFNAVAVALKAASAGTPIPSGIHINKLIHQTSTSWPVNGTLTMQEPATGNLFVIEYSNNAVGITSITDSDSGTWHQIPNNSSPGMWWSGNRTADPNLILTFNITGGTAAPQSLRFFDISGAATSPLDTWSDRADFDTSHQTVANDDPDFTPTGANELVIAANELGDGPGLGFNTGAPAGAVFDLTTYTSENDMDLMENADAVAHLYNTTTAAETWNWQITNQALNSSGGVAAAFIAAPAGGGSTPSRRMRLFQGFKIKIISGRLKIIGN